MPLIDILKIESQVIRLNIITVNKGDQLLPSLMSMEKTPLHGHVDLAETAERAETTETGLQQTPCFLFFSLVKS
jgi:hypothetical protein